ncbi:ATP-binding protein [Couchioplanes caeruleus]|nr:ATP-binding protein [Couchioplanes caeruleus]
MADHGHGVGLAACQRIVERHGGHIWADGAPGGGTTIAFTLPGA